jgi:hypothetical protein
MVASRRLSALFQGLQGIRVQTSSIHGFGIEEIRQDGDGNCVVHVYVNGRRLHRSPTGERVSLDEVFPVRVMDGLEYHAAPDGPVFEEDGCGSLLLWSQELRTPQDRTLHTSIVGRVLSSPPDTVRQVELEPVGRRQAVGPDGEFAFRDLLPGEYEVVFLTDTRPIARLRARIFAFRDSRFDLEVGEVARRYPALRLDGGLEPTTRHRLDAAGSLQGARRSIASDHSGRSRRPFGERS